MTLLNILQQVEVSVKDSSDESKGTGNIFDPTIETPDYSSTLLILLIVFIIGLAILFTIIFYLNKKKKTINNIY